MAEIIFTGNLGGDSTIRYTQNGSPVLNFRVADSHSKKQEDGTWKELASQWFNCTLWGSIAEHLADSLKRGVRVKVYGTYYDRPYTANDGTQAVSKDVKVSGVEVLTPYKERQAQHPQHSQPPTQQGWGGQSQAGWGNPPAQQEPNGWGSQPQSEQPPF